MYSTTIVGQQQYNVYFVEELSAILLCTNKKLHFFMHQSRECTGLREGMHRDPEMRVAPALSLHASGLEF